MPTSTSRIVAQFSCGAASAVATKLALADYGATHDVQILNAYLANEHADNRRFLADCEAWFARPVTVLRDEKYGADIIKVFRRERFMKNQYGAPVPSCSSAACLILGSCRRLGKCAWCPLRQRQRLRMLSWRACWGRLRTAASLNL